MPTTNPIPTIPCCGDGCSEILTLGVQRSAAGYFLGYRCDECGPHSRLSAYTKDEAIAKAGLELNRDPRRWAIWEIWAEDNLYDAR